MPKKQLRESSVTDVDSLDLIKFTKTGLFFTTEVLRNYFIEKAQFLLILYLLLLFRMKLN